MDAAVASFFMSLSWGAIVCLGLGLIFVIIEMFVPGFGFFGITGGALLLLGIFLAARNVTEGLVLTLIIALILGIALVVILQFMSKGNFKKLPIILNSSTSKEEGYIAVEDLKDLLGQQGEALTDLRPAGAADFDGMRMDVVSDGEYILKGQKVRVASVEGRRVLVKPVKDAGPEAEASKTTEPNGDSV